MDVTGVHEQPQENYNKWAAPYFICCIIISNFFCLNVILTVIVTKFQEIRNQGEGLFSFHE